MPRLTEALGLVIHLLTDLLSLLLLTLVMMIDPIIHRQGHAQGSGNTMLMVFYCERAFYYQL